MAGWMVVLAANYLGGLNTGPLMPLIVSATQLIALFVAFLGIRELKSQSETFGRAGQATILAMLTIAGLGVVQFLSLESVSAWMSIAAISLTFCGDLLFLLLTGLTLYGIMKQETGQTATSKRLDLRYRWVLFLTFDIIYLLVQSMAVVLVNENLPALTYVVPATGLPVLIAGAMIVTEVYQSDHRQETK